MSFFEKKNITKNDWSKDQIQKINLKEYEIGCKISKYNYGCMSFCKKINTNKIFTIKSFKKSMIIDNKLSEHITNEYTNLTQIYHPFICELKGINCTDPYNLYFLFEYVLGDPLKLFIKKSKKLPLENARFYIASLVTVLDYLHKKNIIHRDLRPENILINSDGYIKLTEFTFSKKIKNDLTYSIVGISEYYSPEMIKQSGYNKSIDFWQLGILLYEMLVGYTPFIDSNPMELLQKIQKGKITFPKGINKKAKLIIKHFLHKDMNKRLGCTKKGIFQILEEPFFDGFDWEGLLRRTLKPPFIPHINRESYNFKTKFLEDDNYLEQNKVAVPREKDIFYNW